MPQDKPFQPEPVMVTASPPLTRVFVLIAAFSVLFILGMVLARQLEQLRTPATPSRPTETNEIVTTPQTVPPVETTAVDYVYYTNEKGIYRLPLNFESEEQEAELLAREEGIQLAVRYDDLILFETCNASGEEGQRCQLQRYTISNDTTAALRTLPFNHRINGFDYHPDTDLFAYTIQEDADVTFFVIELASNTIVLQETLGTRVGRGLSVDDSFVVLFSPDGAHVLATDTALVEGEFERPVPSMHLFNLEQKEKIDAFSSQEGEETAALTHPVWRSADELLYKDLTTTPPSMVSYTIETGETAPVPFEDDLYAPSIRDDLLVYWAFDETALVTLTLADLGTGEAVSTLPNVIRPISWIPTMQSVRVSVRVPSRTSVVHLLLLKKGWSM